MKELMIKFKKAGGMNLVKQYLKAGVLFFAITDILRLGTSQKALEILRLSVQFKIQKKLKKKYSYVINSLNEEKLNSIIHKQSNKVWICWLQGINNAPKLVQKCYESVKQNLKDREIIIITSENILEYVVFPDYIWEKYKCGVITKTHFSDLLRLELLIKYGGLWIDATVLCTSSNIPKYIYNSDLFVYQILKPGQDGQSQLISSWLMSSCSNNKILLATRAMLYEYWKNNNFILDYYLLHTFFAIACEQYTDEWNLVVKQPNSIPHILLLELFEKYNEEEFERVKAMTCFHKLSYKHDKKLIEKRGTYYDVIINLYND